VIFAVGIRMNSANAAVRLVTDEDAAGAEPRFQRRLDVADTV
jgi:hypothetical protein